MLETKNGIGGCLLTAATIGLPHSFTAMPMAMMRERPQLSLLELDTLKAINRFGQYRAFVATGITFLIEKAGMVSGIESKWLVLGTGLLALDALVTSVYTLVSEKKYYS